MTEALFQVLAAAFKIWEHKEKNKYLDEIMRLQKEYYAEINKPFESRDNSVLDNIGFELRTLGSTFAASVGKPDA